MAGLSTVKPATPGSFSWTCPSWKESFLSCQMVILRHSTHASRCAHPVHMVGLGQDKCTTGTPTPPCASTETGQTCEQASLCFHLAALGHNMVVSRCAHNAMCLAMLGAHMPQLMRCTCTMMTHVVVRGYHRSQFSSHHVGLNSGH